MQNQTFDIHIYHTSDVHGHLTSDSFTDLKDLPKGLARVSTFFKTQTYDHQIKIDLGDTIQGSPLTYLYKEDTKKEFNPFAEAINHIEYDYFVVGNHDFNYGLDYLNDFTHQIHAKTLCANVIKDNQLFFKYAYDIITYDQGPRVAILGITNNYIPNWELEENIKDLVFINAFESAKMHIEEIKALHQPDLIIVGYHGGYECNLETGENEAKNDEENLGCKIFRSLKDIDLLLTGHEHRQLVLKDQQRGMVQPGYAASHVSHAKFSLKEINGIWSIESLDLELVSMKDYEDDHLLMDKLSNFISKSNILLDQKIGQSKPVFLIQDPFQARLRKHPIFQYINEVQMKTTGAMISLCSLGNDVTGFHQEITLRDVLNTYVFPNTLYLCEIKGDTLLFALEHNAQFFRLDDQDNIIINKTYLYPKKELYNYDIFDGISYEVVVNKHKPNFVRNVKYQDVDIKPSETYTIVLNSYRMSGGGNITWHKALKVIKSYPLDITELLIDDIKNRQMVEINYVDNVKVIKGM